MTKGEVVLSGATLTLGNIIEECPTVGTRYAVIVFEIGRELQVHFFIKGDMLFCRYDACSILPFKQRELEGIEKIIIHPIMMLVEVQKIKVEEETIMTSKILVGNELSLENIAKLCGDRGLFIKFAEADGKTELLYVSVQNGSVVSGLGSEVKKPVSLEGKVSAKILSSSVTGDAAESLYVPDKTRLSK